MDDSVGGDPLNRHTSSVLMYTWGFDVRDTHDANPNLAMPHDQLTAPRYRVLHIKLNVRFWNDLFARAKQRLSL